ncbi:MAG: choice-of-anchor Q domain-containing protein [Gemmataceae bacterium]
MRTRLNVLNLESRITPNAYMVSNTNNAGPDSLRQAISDANVHLGPDTITFDAFTFAVPQTINLSGQLAINDPVTIVGPGSVALTVTNTAAQSTTSRVLEVLYTSAKITGMKLTGGNCTNSGGGVYIYNSTVTMDDVTASSNYSTQDGGGIAIENGSSLTLTNSTVSNNFAKLWGGGIEVDGDGSSLTLSNSSVSSNQADPTNVYSFGGGISAELNTVLSIDRCTIANNKSGGSGGGICDAWTNVLVLSSASISLTNSTIVGNQAVLANLSNYQADEFGGGGINIGLSDATIALCTVSGNSAVNVSNGHGTYGGGIACDPGAIINSCTIVNNAAAGFGGGIAPGFTSAWGSWTATSITNSIIYGNTVLPGLGKGPDVYGGINADHCLFGTESGVTFYADAGNIAAVDPHLGPLANNGGPTMTCMLQTGSIALDAGINPTLLVSDQRRRRTGARRREALASLRAAGATPESPCRAGKRARKHFAPFPRRRSPSISSDTDGRSTRGGRDSRECRCVREV